MFGSNHLTIFHYQWLQKNPTAYRLGRYLLEDDCYERNHLFFKSLGGGLIYPFEYAGAWRSLILSG